MFNCLIEKGRETLLKNYSQCNDSIAIGTSTLTQKITCSRFSFESAHSNTASASATDSKISQVLLWTKTILTDPKSASSKRFYYYRRELSLPSVPHEILTKLCRVDKEILF